MLKKKIEECGFLSFCVGWLKESRPTDYRKTRARICSTTKFTREKALENLFTPTIVVCCNRAERRENRTVYNPIRALVAIKTAGSIRWQRVHIVIGRRPRHSKHHVQRHLIILIIDFLIDCSSQTCKAAATWTCTWTGGLDMITSGRYLEGSPPPAASQTESKISDIFGGT